MNTANTNESLFVQLEALLFVLGRPMTHKELADKLGVTVEDVRACIDAARGTARGVVVVDDGKEVELRTSPEASELALRVRKEEVSRDIGRAGLEALAAIVYRGPLSRSEIDFIRGVNSSQTLRTLLMRGLVRRVPHPKDERSFLYEPTTELLSELGIEHVSDAPEYATVKEKLQALEVAYRAEESQP